MNAFTGDFKAARLEKGNITGQFNPNVEPHVCLARLFGMGAGRLDQCLANAAALNGRINRQFIKIGVFANILDPGLANDTPR